MISIQSKIHIKFQLILSLFATARKPMRKIQLHTGFKCNQDRNVTSLIMMMFSGIGIILYGQLVFTLRFVTKAKNTIDGLLLIKRIMTQISFRHLSCYGATKCFSGYTMEKSTSVQVF
jgi:hypothetical protein